MDTELLPILDQVIEIPMFGKNNSLNVAACAPIAMYAILRQWILDDYIYYMHRGVYNI